MTTQTEQTEANKALVRRCWEETHLHHNADIVDELCEPAYGARLKDWVQWTQAAFSDLQWTLEELLGDGDRVALRFSARARQVGAWPVGGLGTIPPTGREFTTKGVHIYRVVGGRIVEDWSAFDLLGPLLQLGAEVKLPPAAPEASAAECAPP